jgi:hypothetical protein
LYLLTPRTTKYGSKNYFSIFLIRNGRYRMNDNMIKKVYELDGENLKLSVLNHTLDSMWEELQGDTGLRDMAEEQGIDLSKLEGLKREEAFVVGSDEAGADATAIFITILAPVATTILIDLWKIFLEHIRQKKGKSSIVEKGNN